MPKCIPYATDAKIITQSDGPRLPGPSFRVWPTRSGQQAADNHHTFAAIVGIHMKSWYNGLVVDIRVREAPVKCQAN